MRNAVLVEVIDQGHGFERVLRQEDFGRVGGHGLSIVDAESSRWDPRRHDPRMV
jgi:hypothetical protein